VLDFVLLGLQMCWGNCRGNRWGKSRDRQHTSIFGPTAHGRRPAREGAAPSNPPSPKPVPAPCLTNLLK